MPHLAEELELRRSQRVLLRESQVRLEEAALVNGVRWSDDQDVPRVDIVVVHQAGRESFDRVLFEFFGGRGTKGIG